MTTEQLIEPMRSLAARLRRYVGTTHSPGVYTPPDICSPRRFRAALQREQARAERNGHRLTLALLPVNDHGREAPAAPRLVEVLRERLRVMDEAGWFDDSWIGVLMPYTSSDGAWRMIEDVCHLMDQEPAPRDCQVYTYPYDWVAGEEDYRQEAEEACVAGHLQHPTANSLSTTGRGRCPDEPGLCATSVSDEDSPGRMTVHPLQWQFCGDLSTAQRCLDIAGSLVGLLVAAPLFLGSALLIKLVSRGPVFFKQVRIGQGAKPFLLWKLRTMRVDADTSIHRNHVARFIRSDGQNGESAARPMTKLNDDPRVIPLGRFLRGACIDELPQLINVLWGEMSLVGPRPPIPYEVQDYQPWQRRRLDAVPGLTGLWQVSGKNKLTFDEMVRLDIRYNRKKSLRMNIGIMLRTPRVIAEEIADAWVRWKMRVRVSEDA
jgi:lipopolysaccharide/colanic/teichoic acid biosynthesis glycosyltransferase